MSRLTDKYQSYDHFKGISFDQATFTATPTRTGSRLYNGAPVDMSDGNFLSDGLQSPTIQTGVMPNQKYYEFEFDNTAGSLKNARLIFGNTSAGTSGGTDDVRRLMWDGTPFDRVVGVWVKMPSNFTAAANGFALAAMRWMYGTAPMINVAPAKSMSGNPAIFISHGSTEMAPGAASNTYYESYTDQSSNVVPIQYDKWYFVAIRKTVNITGDGAIGSVVTGTLTYEHYINGELVGTVSRTTWTKRSVSGIIFGNNASVGIGKLGISSWFITDWSVVNQTALRDIYDYGAPIQAPVKYYNGTAWVDDASAPKVYYNGAWQDVYASRFDGTAWIPL